MSIEVEERNAQTCAVCAAQASELRRGRCWTCYTQWAELRPVGRGASCVVCSERRRDNLRITELHGRSHPFCHICASRVARLAVIPETLESIRLALQRERRNDNRRDDHLDGRIFPRERRVGDRRRSAGAAHRGDTNPCATLPEFDFDIDDIIIELDLGDMDVADQTLVRELPTGPSAST
jgi:hypothetical protein